MVFFLTSGSFLEYMCWSYLLLSRWPLYVAGVLFQCNSLLCGALFCEFQLFKFPSALRSRSTLCGTLSCTTGRNFFGQSDGCSEVSPYLFLVSQELLTFTAWVQCLYNYSFTKSIPVGGCYSISYKWKSYPFTLNLAEFIYLKFICCV